MRTRPWFLWTFALLTGACASTREAGRDSASGDDAERLSANISRSRKGNEKIVEYDLNHDQRADVWSFSVARKGEDGKEFDALVRKELDINWDGKVDISRSYATNGQLEREELDLDFDGKIDQVNIYESGVLVKKERDLDYNGSPDLWVFFEKGQIGRKERDTNADGKIDYWEYWEGEQVDRVGEDLDGDGNVDRWTKNPNPQP